MRDHAGRVPVVLAARLGRVWDVFRPAQKRVFEASEGRPARSERLGVCCTGCSPRSPWRGRGCCARARQLLAILLAPAAMVTLTALLSYGWTRFRFAAEPSIVVLAAWPSTRPLRRRRARRERPARLPARRAARARRPRGRRQRQRLALVDLVVLAQGLIVTRLLGPEAIGLYGVVT